MMSYFKDWWKSLFSGSGVTDELGLPVMKREDLLPMPEVKPYKPENDISEPVLSFIKLYKENPKNFRVKRKSEDQRIATKHVYSVFDRVNSKLFSVSKTVFYTYCGDLDYRTGINTGWATQDEIKEVFDVILEERKSRYKELTDKRHSLQRQRLTKLYKGE